MPETLRQLNEIGPVQNTGLLLVVSGPSGAGKDTLANSLAEDKWLKPKKIVTYTTRPPRVNEVDGIDYNFVSESEFNEMVEAGKFAEFVQYGESMKGTLRKPFQQVLEHTGNYIWRIDPTRAANVKPFILETFGQDQGAELTERTVVFYVGVNRLTTLLARVRKREGNKFDRINFLRRLKEDWLIWQKNSTMFKNVIYNDMSVSDMTDNAKNIIYSHFQGLNSKTKPQTEALTGEPHKAY